MLVLCDVTVTATGMYVKYHFFQQLLTLHEAARVTLYASSTMLKFLFSHRVYSGSPENCFDNSFTCIILSL